MNNLVIVESPTKSRTLQKFLGSGFRVEATMGHVRDLPKSEFGVDVLHDFEPEYVIPRDKRKVVNELTKTAQQAKTLWLATDPDREGEAIAWHIKELIVNRESSIGKNKNDKRPTINDIRRVVFHEITEDAIKEAFKNPGQINLKLVDAQQARRVLDRLVGYKLSPLLWRKVKRGSSAGRVQSVTLRLIVEREREISAFKAEEYWVIEAELSTVIPSERSERGNLDLRKIATSPAPETVRDPRNDESVFLATLIEQDGKKLAIKNKEEADGHVKNLEKATYSVSKITQKEIRRYPYPPFITSTLQQAASNKLGMSAKKTMMLAQNLYEHGFITYMRTDSVNLSPSAVFQVRSYIEQFIGKAYSPKVARVYKSKSKNVQEAHEAIRPTDVRTQGDALRGKGGFNRDHIRLYDLIWKRFVACQMSEAVLDQTSVDVTASQLSVLGDQLSDYGQSVVSSLVTEKQKTDKPESENRKLKTDNRYLLRATGSVIQFEGWLKLYGKDVEEDSDEKKQVLPPLKEQEPLNLIQLLPGQHFTEPPPRYTEASLIKKLEELGIGRPSTYAPIISTIQDRFYVERLERKFVPTALGFAVTDFLLEYFSEILDYSFTAQMEDELDEIAKGLREWRPIIREFYTPFEKKLEETAQEAEKVKMVIEYAGKKCPECGKDLIVRVGRFGKFLACSGFPDCHHTESIEETVGAKCPLDGGEILKRLTKKGKTFYGCKNWPECKFASWTKPKGGDKPEVST